MHWLLEGRLSEPYFLALLPAITAAILVTGWIDYVGGTTAGNEPREFGVIEYDRGVFSGRVRTTEWTWSELGGTTASGRWFVKIETPGSALYLTDIQARALLSDPRFPPGNAIDETVRVRLRIERDGARDP